MERLQQLYPNNLKLIPNVGFKMKNGISGSKDVWVISLNGLNQSQKTELKDAYLKAISFDTISFPLGESPGQLYTRLGEKTLDFIGSVDDETYRLSSGDRLESVMTLSPNEFMNLRTYVDNAQKSDNVVGDFGYDAGSSPTNGRLDNNLYSDGRTEHNCTSWLCTAPIGRGGRPIYALAGASRGYEVYTNPGWWQSFLSASAPADRVPFNIRWTAESLEQISQTIKSGQEMPWDFDAH